MTKPALMLSLLGLSTLALTACEPPSSPVTTTEVADAVGADPLRAPELPEPEGAGAEPVEATFHYSPFVLEVKGERPAFRAISFKDVGVPGLGGEDERYALYEAIAESVAYELSLDQSLAMPASVAFDTEILDPANHLACGSDHLYVDFWQAEGKNRWGYSLWSGCGDDDNFAWQEIEFVPNSNGDVLEEVTPLASSILKSLRDANARGCYQKAC